MTVREQVLRQEADKAWSLAYKELTDPGKVNNTDNYILISYRFLWECETIG